MKILEFINKATKYIDKLIDDWLQSDRRRVLLLVFVVLCIVRASQQEWFRLIIAFLENFPQVIEASWIYICWLLFVILFIWVIKESIKPPSFSSLELLKQSCVKRSGISAKVFCYCQGNFHIIESGYKLGLLKKYSGHNKWEIIEYSLYINQVSGCKDSGRG